MYSYCTMHVKQWTVLSFVFNENTRTDPIQNGCPPFHGDALEHGEHGKPDVIERRDPIVRTFPALYARGRFILTEVRIVRLRWFTRVRVWIARRRARSLDFHCVKIIQPADKLNHYFGSYGVRYRCLLKLRRTEPNYAL